MCGHIRKEWVRNDNIRARVGVSLIAKKLVRYHLRWFGHIQHKSPDAPVHSGWLKHADNVKICQSRPNLTWEESLRRELKDLSITKELSMDRASWKLAIHVPEPLVGCEIFWVSPLAYPNFFGTKGFVIVVVVVNFSMFRSFKKQTLNMIEAIFLRYLLGIISTIG
jgi:hypothetical protein